MGRDFPEPKLDRGERMTTPFIGEIQIFGFNFPPYQWAFANGALLSIGQNTTLFALLGATYGGDGRQNFRLPNFVGRVGVSQGQGPGLADRILGDTVGENTVSLIWDEMPYHAHNLQAYPQPATDPGPTAGAGLGGPRSARLYSAAPSPNTTLYPTVVNPAGGSQPHENRQPALALNYSIALYGEFPRFD